MLTEFLQRLEGVKKAAGYHLAKCPAHEDKRQSLSITTGNDGRLLLKCHAGCSSADIVRALGIEMKDLFPPRETSTIAATYDYLDEFENLLFQVVRMSPKTFRQRKPNGQGGWDWKLGDVRRVLYRLPLIAAADPEDVVFVVEGEKDADLLIDRGLAATTSAGGAGKWRPEYSESLRGREVVVLPDNDNPGRAHAEQVAKSLTGIALRVRVIALPGLPDKGDVTDWFRATGGVGLGALVNLAPEWEPDKVVAHIEGFENAASRLVDERAERQRIGKGAIPFGIAFLDDCCRAILPTDVIVIGARTGVGKTQLVTSVAQNTASAGKNVYVFALEAEPKEIERRAKYREIVTRLYARGIANISERMSYIDWYLGRCDDLTRGIEDEIDAELSERYKTLHTFYRCASRFDTKALARVLDEIKEQADLIVLDHLHYVDSDESSENSAVKKVVMTIRDSALASGKPAIVVAHLRKRERGRVQIVPELDDFHGSSDITKICTRAIVIGPARDQESPQKSLAPTYIAVRKDRPVGVFGDHVALCYFDLTSFSYRDSYRLGHLNFAGDEWVSMGDEGVPTWAKHSTQMGRMEGAEE